MVHGLYTVRDRAAEQCAPVFQAVNDAVASRAMVRLMRDVPAYDRDAYQLVKVGSFDDETGSIFKVEYQIIDFTMPKFDQVEVRKFGFENGVD